MALIGQQTYLEKKYYLAQVVAWDTQKNKQTRLQMTHVSCCVAPDINIYCHVCSFIKYVSHSPRSDYAMRVTWFGPFNGTHRILRIPLSNSATLAFCQIVPIASVNDFLIKYRNKDCNAMNQPMHCHSVRQFQQTRTHSLLMMLSCLPIRPISEIDRFHQIPLH